MKLVVGLGNPGPRYAETRHNAGFMVIDRVAARWKASVDRYEAKYEALMGGAMVGEERVLLSKPQTFMNLSGRSVAAVLRFYKLAPQDALIVYDEMDLPIGRVRIRESGSGGGHNGMTDVIRHLGTNEIPRVRLGIGRPHPSESVDHVLSKFDARDRAEVDSGLDWAADAVDCWVRSGMTTTMNRYNRRDDGAAEKGR